MLHVLDFERDHAIAEMLPLRRGIDGDAVIRDQLDDGPAQLQINEIDRHAEPGTLDPIARFHPEPEHLDIETLRPIWLISNDLDMVDPLEHATLPFNPRPGRG